MKRYLLQGLALLGSAACYVGIFSAAAWVLFYRNDRKLFFYGFALLVAAYFIVMGAVFSKKLGLNRWILLGFMNVAGYPFCWVVFYYMNPSRFGFVELPFYLIAMSLLLIMVWSAVLLGYAGVFLLRRLQQKHEPPFDRHL